MLIHECAIKSELYDDLVRDGYFNDSAGYSGIFIVSMREKYGNDTSYVNAALQAIALDRVTLLSFKRRDDFCYLTFAVHLIGYPFEQN